MAKTIKLDKPVLWGGAQVAEISLREPSGLQYLRCGEPRIQVYNPNGGGYYIEDAKAIENYFESCVDHDGGGALLAQVSLADMRKLKDALFDFFRAASAIPSTGPSGTSSSS